MLETENYASEYGESFDESESGDEVMVGPVPLDFAIERFQTDLEEGNIPLDEVLETATIDVKASQ